MNGKGKIAVLASLCAVLVSCEEPGGGDDAPGLVSRFSSFFPGQSEEVELPLERTLVDVQGRELKVEVIAKKGGYLAVKRLQDGEYFSIPLEALGRGDRDFFAKLPESSPKQVAQFKGMKGGRSDRKARWNSSRSSAEFEAEKFSLPTYFLFTGTSWCAPCRSLETKVLSTREFMDFANSNLVLLKVDVPQTRIPDGQKRRLMEEFRIVSFPTVVILDQRGNEVNRLHGYGNKSVSDYLGELERVLSDIR